MATDIPEVPPPSGEMSDAKALEIRVIRIDVSLVDAINELHLLCNEQERAGFLSEPEWNVIRELRDNMVRSLYLITYLLAHCK